MACVIAECSKCEERGGVYGPNVLNQKEVTVWCKKSEDRRTGLNNDPEKKRGRPKTSHTDDNCTIAERLIRKDRRIIVCEIAEIIGIPRSYVYEIICNAAEKHILLLNTLATDGHYSSLCGSSRWTATSTVATYLHAWKYNKILSGSGIKLVSNCSVLYQPIPPSATTTYREDLNDYQPPPRKIVRAALAPPQIISDGEWTDTEDDPAAFLFSNAIFINVNLLKDAAPIEYFQLFFDVEIVSTTVRETNKRANEFVANRSAATRRNPRFQ
ncbi:hypothetical protein ILUMI_23745 [Ignelater luminosus]|uniref:Uncharacterized protein n=1 Tax=Ignelater luminosus TaxID=2038154 RepID=A0A8K0CBI3_IGNLU|nr:hypothetical protein ILUMI_23745 [Ignelater luminosus]